MICPSCGMTLPNGSNGICAHHTLSGDDWHITNKIVCDFIHRGIDMPRLSEEERNTDFWGLTYEPFPTPAREEDAA